MKPLKVFKPAQSTNQPINQSTADAAVTNNDKAAAASHPARLGALSECQALGSADRRKTQPRAPLVQDKGSTYIDYVGAGGEKRIRCPHCLHTAKAEASQNFQSRHKRCGENKREPVRRAKAELPQHIVLKQQKLVGGGDSLRRILNCTICGGFGADTSYSRFIRRHHGCTSEKAARRRATQHLTRRATEVLEHGGMEVQDAGKRKRRRLLNAVLL